MTGVELTALVKLLNRFTGMMSDAEGLWMQGLVQRLAAEIIAREEAERDATKSETPVPDVTPVGDPA